MKYQIIVDTEHLINITSKINDTTSEITNSINSLKKISAELGTNTEDQNMKNFNNNFSDYLTTLNGLSSFYNELSSTINSLAKEYDNVDESNSNELKKIIDKNEQNS